MISARKKGGLKDIRINQFQKKKSLASRIKEVIFFSGVIFAVVATLFEYASATYIAKSLHAPWLIFNIYTSFTEQIVLLAMAITFFMFSLPVVLRGVDSNSVSWSLEPERAVNFGAAFSFCLLAFYIYLYFYVATVIKSSNLFLFVCIINSIMGLLVFIFIMHFTSTSGLKGVLLRLVAISYQSFFAFLLTVESYAFVFGKYSSGTLEHQIRGYLIFLILYYILVVLPSWVVDIERPSSNPYSLFSIFIIVIVCGGISARYAGKAIANELGINRAYSVYFGGHYCKITKSIYMSGVLWYPCIECAPSFINKTGKLQLLANNNTMCEMDIDDHDSVYFNIEDVLKRK